MTVLVQQYVGRLQVSVHDEATVHVLQAQYHFGSVKAHFVLVEHAVLGQMVMEIAAVHEVEDEAQLVGRLESVGHAHNERTVLASRDQREHDPFVECQSFTLFHFDSLLVQTLHGVHFARVRFPAAVHLAEATTANDAVYTEIVHRQLNVEFQILPLAKACILVAATEQTEQNIQISVSVCTI